MSIAQHISQLAPALRWLVIVALVAVSGPAAYAAVTFSLSDPSLAAWWPAAGPSVVAGMVARPRERWLVVPLIVLSTGLGNLAAGREPAFALALGVGNSVEVVLMAAILASNGRPLLLSSLRATTTFIAAALASAFAAGLVLGSAATVFLDRALYEAIGQLTASHASATLVMLPLVLVPLRDGRPLSRWELLAQSTLFLSLLGTIFWPGNSWPVTFVPLVAILWAALRFPLLITAIELVITAFAVILLTTLGGGPFAVVVGEPRLSVLLVQLFLLVYAVAALLIVGARTDWFLLIRRLEAQESLLRAGIVTADAGIVILDRTASGIRTVAINPQARRALGGAVPPYGVPELDQAVADARPTKVEFSRDGHSFEAVVTDTSVNGATDLVSIVILDVTEREERERQSRELADELRHLNAQKDDFISAVSHELRTPVTSIIGFSEDLDDGRLPPELAQSGIIIARNARRLADVIEDVLELSRLGALGGTLPDPAEVDLVRLATECAADAEGLALSRNVRVVVSERAPATLVIRSRERDLVRVCANLLSNAVKFSHEKGRVAVELEGTADGGAVVRVIDHGIGIPPEYHDLVWQRFARAPLDSHRAVPGTGLGLPIVKALLETRLGGSARLYETPGGGTTVEVRLPAVAPDVSSLQTGD